MNKSLKPLVIFLTSLLSFGAVGCSGANQSSNKTSSEETSQQVSETSANSSSANSSSSSASSSEVESHTHNYVAQSVTPPTCEEQGYTTYVCSECGDTYKDDFVPALGHTLTKHEAVEATCIEDGSIEYYECSTCHKLFLDAEGKKEVTLEGTIVHALGHNLIKHELVDATCLSDGCLEYYECERCHKIFADAEGKQETTIADLTIEALGHNMVKHDAVPATVSDEGNNEYYECQNCHKYYSDAEGQNELTADQIFIPRGQIIKAADLVSGSADNVTTPNLTQGEGNKILYTRGESDEQVRLVVGEQNGNPVSSLEFDMNVNLGDWGDLRIFFRRWDGANECELVRENGAIGNKQLSWQHVKWTTQREVIAKKNINGLTFENGVDYHVQILCRGWTKTVFVNDKVIYRYDSTAGEYCGGYFGLESYAAQAITLNNMRLRKYTGTDAEQMNKFDADYPAFWTAVDPSISYSD